MHRGIGRNRGAGNRMVGVRCVGVEAIVGVDDALPHLEQPPLEALYDVQQQRLGEGHCP